MIFVLFFCIVQAMGYVYQGTVVQNSVVNVAAKKKNPCVDPMVEMVVSDIGDMEEFHSMMSEIQIDFQNIPFVTVDVRDKDENVQVPALNMRCNGHYHAFPYTMNAVWVHRWIRDSLDGHFKLVRKISVADSLRDKFDASVHVLSPKRPHLEFLAGRMPSVGFAWTSMKGTRFRNTVITSDVFGRVYMRHNHSVNDLLHTLLPPVIPYELAVSDIGNEIMSGFAKREVHVISDGVLPDIWASLVQQYPLTAFIQMSSEESGLPDETVWIYRRSLDFRFDGIGNEVREWLSSVANGTAIPVKRMSKEPETAHDTLFDATGSNMWDWVRSHENILLYLYTDTSDECRLESRTDVVTGRMDIGANDHELLPDHAKEGMVLHILDYGRNVIVKDCAQALTRKITSWTNVRTTKIEL